jgi:hypothetical protein
MLDNRCQGMYNRMYSRYLNRSAATQSGAAYLNKQVEATGDSGAASGTSP